MLAVARRAHMLAHALPEPERSRILKYVTKLEAEAAALLAADGRADARRAKRRRPTVRAVRSARVAEPKVPRG